MLHSPTRSPSQRVSVLRQLLLAFLIAILVFVPDDQFAVRVAAGIVCVSVFWVPPVVRLVAGFRAGYRGE